MRLGKFSVSIKMVNDHTSTVGMMLAQLAFVPTRVEMLYEYNSFEYQGLSPLFREVPEGQIIPKYKVYIESTDDSDEVVVEEVI